MLLEIPPITPPEIRTLAYVIGGVLALGALAVAVNAILKFFDRFRTPLVTAQEFADWKRRLELVEHRTEQAFDKMDGIQNAMTEAAEARSDKLLDAIHKIKSR